MTDLFQKIDFISHSGLPLTWKIECDGISADEWVALAHIIREYETRDWQYAIGIPRGGVKLAKELDKYSTNDQNDPILIVDDVYTTGRSFRDFSKNFNENEVIKWCVFARKPIQEDVNALFTMPLKG